jgi:hypothetical protein
LLGLSQGTEVSHGTLNVQVYYGAWRGLEVAVKVMSADITQQVAAGLEVNHQLSVSGRAKTQRGLQQHSCADL